MYRPFFLPERILICMKMLYHIRQTEIGMERKQMKKILLCITTCTVAVLVFLFFKHQQTLSFEWFSSKIDTISFSGPNQTQEKKFFESGFSSVSYIRLTPAEFKERRDQLIRIVDEKDPESALEDLDRTSQSMVRIDCHNLTHEIGNRAYQKYQDLVMALNHAKQVCGFGYTHGAIESYVEASDNSLETLKVMCDTYTEKRDKLQCHHAAGHALMIYYGNDVPLALKGCDRYADDRAKKFCAQGLFMENFSADEDHRSQFVSSENPFYPCNEQKDIYKSDCYLMAPLYYMSLHPDGFKTILKWCSTAEKKFKGWCVRGAAFQTLRYDFTSKEMEQFCLSGTKDQVKPCIDGVVHFAILDYPELIDTYCDERLTLPETQEACRETMKVIISTET